MTSCRKVGLKFQTRTEGWLKSLKKEREAIMIHLLQSHAFFNSGSPSATFLLKKLPIHKAMDDESCTLKKRVVLTQHSKRHGNYFDVGSISHVSYSIVL